MSKTMRVLLIILIVFGLAAIGVNVYFNLFAPKALKVKRSTATLGIPKPKDTPLTKESPATR